MCRKGYSVGLGFYDMQGPTTLTPPSSVAVRKQPIRSWHFLPTHDILIERCKCFGVIMLAVASKMACSLGLPKQAYLQPCVWVL